MSTTPETQEPAVLIVDDDADAIRVVLRLLEKRPYRVLTAKNGEEALEVLSANDVDLILLDVMMPGMSGLELCRKLHEDSRYCELPVILLTGLDDFRTRHEGMKLGVSQFMCKPFTRHELVERIEAQLRVRRISKDLDDVENRL